MNSAELAEATRTGSIPNYYGSEGLGPVTPKDWVYFTDEPLVNSASTAAYRYEIATPDFAVRFPLENVNGPGCIPGEPFTSGGGTQFVTENTIPMEGAEIIPLNP